MAIYDLVLPKMGESVEEATITNWKKNVGDKVAIDDIIVEVATDKVDSEIPSPVNGVIKEIIIKKDSIAKVGQAMAKIEIEDSATPNKEEKKNEIIIQSNSNISSKGYELILPKMGESVEEATITNWKKNVGDKVAIDDIVVEVATDKVDSEIPSPVNGIIKEIIIKKDSIAKVGQVMAIISTNDNTSSTSKKNEENPINNDYSIKTISASTNYNSNSVNNDNTKLTRFYSPLVKSIAAKENISNSELENINGSGHDGRVTKDDILKYLDSRKTISNISSYKNENIPSINSIKNTDNKINSIPITIDNNDEVIEMSRMRKIISDHMVMSKKVSAHVTSCVESDVTNIVKWREKVKVEYEKKYKQKLTYTPIFVQAIVEALKSFAMINVSVNGDKIIKHGNINIGMATALPNGDLIVPVIKNADRQNLLGLTTSVNDLASRARINKLSPDDIKGATYTFTNVGGFGNTIVTPIINQPQVAILGIGAIVKRPAVVETKEGDMIAIRHMMFLSHSYDHRVVDGALGGMFVKKVSDFLEKWDINTPI